MGKQLSIYLPEEAAQRLFSLAAQECRRPHDQARYLILRSLENAGQLAHPMTDRGAMESEAQRAAA